MKCGMDIAVDMIIPFAFTNFFPFRLEFRAKIPEQIPQKAISFPHHFLRKGVRPAPPLQSQQNLVSFVAGDLFMDFLVAEVGKPLDFVFFCEVFAQFFNEGAELLVEEV